MEPMPNLSIKNVPREIVQKLRERATANHRSLQGELMALVCSAIADEDAEKDAEKGAKKKAQPDRLETGWKSVYAVLADRIDEHARSVTKGPLAVDIIRKERNAR